MYKMHRSWISVCVCIYAPFRENWGISFRTRIMLSSSPRFMEVSWLLKMGDTRTGALPLSKGQHSNGLSTMPSFADFNPNPGLVTNPMNRLRFILFFGPMQHQTADSSLVLVPFRRVAGLGWEHRLIKKVILSSQCPDGFSWEMINRLPQVKWLR